MTPWLVLTLATLPTAQKEKEIPQGLRDKAVAATVMVVSTKGTLKGSGTLLGNSGAVHYVLTAAHLVPDGSEVEIRVFTPQSYPKPARIIQGGQVVAKGDKNGGDVALVRFSAVDAIGVRITVCPQDAIPKQKSFKAYSVGGGKLDEPVCRSEQVIGVKRIGKAGEKTSSLCWETRDKPVPGRSGGPLLDAEGRLLGVCSGAHENKGYYCHLEPIHAFVRQNGLSWLLESSASKK